MHNAVELNVKMTINSLPEFHFKIMNLVPVQRDLTIQFYKVTNNFPSQFIYLDKSEQPR